MTTPPKPLAAALAAFSRKPEALEGSADPLRPLPRKSDKAFVAFAVALLQRSVEAILPDHAEELAKAVTGPLLVGVDPPALICSRAVEHRILHWGPRGAWPLLDDATRELVVLHLAFAWCAAVGERFDEVHEREAEDVEEQTLNRGEAP